MASFREAIRQGSDWLEFDVRMSADDVPVVIHDATLKRTTSGKGTVRARTLAELRRLDAGSWYDARYSGEKIPTLDELIKLGTRVRLNIEIKPNSASPSSLAEAVWGRVQA